MDVDVISEVEQAYLDAKSAVETAIANGIENIADLTAAAHVAHEAWLAAQATASLFARRNLQAHEDLRSFVIHIVENPDGHTSDEVADAWTGIQHHEDAHRALVIAHGSNLDPPVAHLDPYVSQATALSDLVSYDTSSGIDVSEDGSTLLFTVGTPDSSAVSTSMTFTTTEELTVDKLMLIGGGGSGSTHRGGGGGSGGLVQTQSTNYVLPAGTHTISLGHGGPVAGTGDAGIGAAGGPSTLIVSRDGNNNGITAYGGNHAGVANITVRGSTGGGDSYVGVTSQATMNDGAGVFFDAGFVSSDEDSLATWSMHHNRGGAYAYNSGGGGGGTKTEGGYASSPSYGGSPGHPFRVTMPSGDYQYFGAGGGGGYHAGTPYDPGYASIGGTSSLDKHATPAPANSHGSGGGGGGPGGGLGAAGSHGALLLSFSHHGSTPFSSSGVTVV